jgi:hypothetical protein
MKSLRDYLTESEHRAVNPVEGDDFVFEFDDGTAVETYILEATADEILVDANEATWAVMEQWMGFDDILSEGCACEAELDEDQDATIVAGKEIDDEITSDDNLDEAEYQGRKVTLNKPTRGDQKKFKVYVRDPKTGNVKKVNFGHGGTSAKRLGQKTMKIKKSNPARRKSFRARHNCANPGPRTKARYWSCRAW